MAVESHLSTLRPSRKAFWAGWVLSVLPAPLLLFSAAMKFVLPPLAV